VFLSAISEEGPSHTQKCATNYREDYLNSDWLQGYYHRKTRIMLDKTVFCLLGKRCKLG